ncbi:hypothetical protein F4780DRAFT_760579 [Xylariomycetidae sp. FL0641]|nr:hypothetical protein F4780DRAFT_760579 [Xylariomycetidae sp. FL0641]
MSVAEEVIIDPQTIKELHLLEAATSDVDNELSAKHYLMMKPIMAEREKTIAKIPSFWSVVLDNAASELEAAITADDQEVFAHALTSIEVARPEIPASAQPSDMGLDKFGEPRSIALKFSFKENAWFSETELTKIFWFRYGKDGSSGLVSEPIKISWKPGKDLTEGLTDAAYAFWAAQKANASQKLEDGVLSNAERHARDAAAQQMPEYQALETLLKSKMDEEKVNGAMSFFNFFAYRGRWISAAEHAAAKAELDAKRAAAQAGQEEKMDDEDDEDDEDFTEENVEVFPAGHEVAINFAEEVVPNCIDFFLADSIDSDLDLDEDDDEDEEMEG